MKHCNNCNVDVNTSSNYCPLCFNALDDINDNSQPKLLSESQKKPREIIKQHMVRKVFLLISLAAIIITMAINYFAKSSTQWSLLVFFGVIYLWILVKHTIMSNRHIFEKFFFQILGLLSILITSNYISGGGWFLEYVMPALFLAVLVILNMMLFVNPKRRYYEITFLIIELLLLIASIVFISTSYCTFKILHWSTLLFSIISIAGIIIMDGRNLYQEVIKKFHL